MDNQYDLIILGGGIQGVAIAADAAGRGLKVFLCEQGDLAQGTSSASTKLIHGGLRYLEYYDFSLVYHSLRERDRLIKIAPHLVRPLRFVIPREHTTRPLWLIRAGLYLYDLMGVSRYFLRSGICAEGLFYSDATVDDARLVITTALRAKEQGATLLTYTKCSEVQETSSGWKVFLQNKINNEKWCVTGKVLMNATGPWINNVLENIIKQKSTYRVRLIKGSHIVVPQLYTENHAYLLQHTDGRVVFTIPYHDRFTMIGTTDLPFNGDPSQAAITCEEIDYLCNIISSYFKKIFEPSQIFHAWSGVRCLIEDKTATVFANSREHKIEQCYSSTYHLPLINIFGGKITTHRKVAEKTVNLLANHFTFKRGPWTGSTPLPGGDLSSSAIEYTWLPPLLKARYDRAYGTLMHQFLADAHALSDLGEHFGQELYEKEVRYLIDHEWAKTTNDILWRRTKLGLFFSPEETEKLERWLYLRQSKLT